MVSVTTIVAAICVVFIVAQPSSAEKPQKPGQPLLCHGCVAVLKELHKVLKDSSGRKRIIEQKLNNLCQIQNFVSYTFSPPKMIKGCEYIVGAHKQELLTNLIEYYKKFKTADNLKLQEKFCDRVIKACEGVRRPVTEEEMTPRGLSMEEANQKLKSMPGSEISSDPGQPSLEKPPTHTTPSSKDEL